MNVAVLGTGASAGQLADRLAERGHDVTLHGGRLSLVRAMLAPRGARPGVVLLLAGDALLCAIARGAGIPAVVNVRGLERLAPHLASRLVTDSIAVASRYEQRHGRRVGLVPSGEQAPDEPAEDVLGRLGLEPRHFVLFAGRLESDDDPLSLVEAWARIPTWRTAGMKLVMVGGASYDSGYAERVRRAADPRVMFPGLVSGAAYRRLQRSAYLFCAPSPAGGAHPVILEALAAGNCVLVNDRLPGAGIAGEAAHTFSGRAGVPDLAAQIERLIREPETVAACRGHAAPRARAHAWDAVASAYEQLLIEAVRRTGHGPLSLEQLDALEQALV